MKKSRLLSHVSWFVVFIVTVAWLRHQEKEQLLIKRIRFLRSVPNNHSSVLAQRLHIHEFANLKFLSFGNSRSWGAGLDDRLNEAYPYLLSATTKNLAIRAAGPETPSLCLCTMLGNKEEYDVIVLDYNHVSRQRKSFQRLSHRLRRRYPHAAMIFVNIWSPYQYRYKGKPLLTILQQEQKNNNSTWLEKILEEQSSSSDDWSFQIDRMSSRIIHDVAEQVHGDILTMPRPENAMEALRSYGMRYFRVNDLDHYSPEGHIFVYHAILDILRQNHYYMPSQVSTTISNGVSHHRSWDQQDWCENWFETGVTTLCHTNMTMNTFDHENTKHALEVQVEEGMIPDDEEQCVVGGILELPILSVGPAQVFVNYMVSGPNKMYPKTRIQWACGNDKSFHQLNNPGMVMDPVLPKAVTMKNVHMVETVLLGYNIPLSKGCLIKFTPLEDRSGWLAATSHRLLPFRVVGIEILPQNADESPSATDKTATMTATEA